MAEQLFKHCRSHGHTYGTPSACTRHAKGKLTCTAQVCTVCQTERHEQKDKGITVSACYRFPSGYLKR